MRRVTLDTNIYISALEFGGIPAELLQMGLDGEIEIAVSRPIIDETVRILRAKFDWSEGDLAGAVSVIEECAHLVKPTQKLNAVPGDPNDNMIIECAVTAGSEAIVTGDKRHLLQLGAYKGIRIMGARAFLERIRPR